MHIWRLYWDFFKQNKSALLANILLIFFNYPFEIILLSYLTSQIFINLNNIDQNWNTVLIYIAIFIACYIVLEFSITLKDYNDSKTIPKLESFVREKIIRTVFQKNEINCYNINLGELIQRLLKIAPSMTDVYDRFNKYLVPLFLTIIVVVGYLFFVNLKLGLIALIAFSIYIWVFFSFSQNQFNLSKKREKQEGQLYNDIEDTLGNIFTVFSLNQLKHETDRLNSQSDQFNKIFEKELNHSARIKFVGSFMNILLFIVLIGSTLYYFRQGEIDQVTTMTLITMTIFLVKHIRGLIRRTSEGLIFIGNLKESEEYLNQLNQQTVKDGKLTTFWSNGEIKFSDVYFKYHGSREDSLHNVRFSLKPKENLIIIGDTGSGKSTLLKLLTGFYQPYKGSVTIDSIKLTDIKKQCLRKHITYLSQNNRLFDRPIIDNIIYGTKYNRASAMKIIDKLDIVRILPHKNLLQMAGKHGDNLSGGQKQIVQLLRSYLLDSKIILLDEPTSAIDPQHKKYVIQLIHELMKHKQVIMVTHDWSLLSMFNRVIYLQKGQIKYDGTPIGVHPGGHTTH